MINRKLILIVSVLLSAGFHGALLANAHKITVQQRNAPAEILARFRVKLRREAPPTLTDTRPPDDSSPTNRPQSIHDLIPRQEDELIGTEKFTGGATDVPNLAERLASDTIAREFEIDQAEASLRYFDAKLLEIDQATARANVQVARRLVRPSPNRVVEPEEFFNTRQHFLPTEEAPLGFSEQEDTASQGETSSNDDDISELVLPPEKPRFEEDVLRPEIVAPDLPVIEIEDYVTLAPIKRETAEARKESNYTFIDDLVNIQLNAYIPPDGGLGYFQLKIVPKVEGSLPVLPKDVTFVVDASNSINQHKLTVTARGVQRAIDLLHPEDYFNVIVFRDSPAPFRPQRVPASLQNKEFAKNFLKDIKSRGATDVYRAILPVLQTPPRPGIPGLVIVITDGRPTTGMRDSRAIINGLSSDNRLRNSIYSFGGGRTVNRQLLNLLAYRNKGVAFVTPRIDDIDEELPRFMATLNEPLLIKLKADYGRIDAENVYPKEVPDFYRGQAVTVYGRFDPATDTDFVMRLTGSAQERQEELVFRTDLQEAASGIPAIARLWAFQKSYHIIGEISRYGETPERLATLQELSQRYNIQTTYNE